MSQCLTGTLRQWPNKKNIHLILNINTFTTDQIYIKKLNFSFRLKSEKELLTIYWHSSVTQQFLRQSLLVLIMLLSGENLHFLVAQLLYNSHCFSVRPSGRYEVYEMWFSLLLFTIEGWNIFVIFPRSDFYVFKRFCDYFSKK